LYGLDENSGLVRWALRVGATGLPSPPLLDLSDLLRVHELRVGGVSLLPVRLPATETTPERLLVVTATPPGLLALDATGSELWRVALDSLCVGRPVVLGRRAYVVTAAGRVCEVETARGELLGWYDLGQSPGAGPAWQQGTDRLYVPGDRGLVYVL